MPEDDPTRDLPPEDQPTEDLEPPSEASSTRPMFDRLLREMITTRELLLARLAEVETRLGRIENKIDAFNKRLVHTETDLVAIENRVEKLESERA